MNIYDDRTLFRLIAGIVFLVFAFSLVTSAIYGGLKAALFVLWLGIAAAAFLGVIALSVRKLTGNYSTGGFIKNYAGIWFDMAFYKFFLIALFIILSFASAGVWRFLDRLPDKKYGDLPVSEIPNPQDPS